MGRIFGLLLMGVALPAHATDGYFQQGFSTREKALGGAGAASPDDAMTIANNPAGLVDVGSQLEIGMGWFRPGLQYSASGTAVVAPGVVKSGRDDFPLPNFGFSRQIDASSAWGVAVYANGGFGTSYGTAAASPFCALVGPGASGVYCGGAKTGVTLDQAVISPGYAANFGSVSIGIAPLIVVQMFDAFGLAPFGAFSGAPGNLSNRGLDYSIGLGVRLGVEWRATDKLRIAATGATPSVGTDFSRYNGLFADHGQLGAPGQVGVGVAYDILPTLTVMGDYKRIFFGHEAAVANGSTNLGLVPLGSNGGPGFGWQDVNVVSIGAEWRVRKDLRLWAGFNWCNDPITPSNVTINILAPAVISQQYSIGLGYDIDSRQTIQFSAMAAPRAYQTGPEAIVAGVPTPGSKITLSAQEFEATATYIYRFDEPTRQVVAAKY
jgi:long-chain fatty acid transport protein